ncbi:hypothetical protein ACSQ67_013723 [Phaseolus vulgaris]
MYQEKDERMKSNPDLYFNSATVNKYLENYQRALSGFEAAALKDPGLNAAEEVQKIVSLLDKVDNLLKGHVRAKRMTSLASSLVAVDLKSPYRRVTIDLLSEGPNRALAVEGKVLFFIKTEGVAPLNDIPEVNMTGNIKDVCHYWTFSSSTYSQGIEYLLREHLRYYLLCDSNQSCFVLSIYGVRTDVVRTAAEVLFQFLVLSFSKVEIHFSGINFKGVKPVAWLLLSHV